MEDDFLVAHRLSDELGIFDISSDHVDRILQIRRQILKIAPEGRRTVANHRRHVSTRARECFREMASYEAGGTCH